MKSFKTFLTENTLTHLTHIEDSILDIGLSGVKSAIYALISVKNMLSGRPSNSSVSIKWDGSPSIIAGYNPDNKKFFVATKSAFNKTPKLCYTKEDIINYYPAGGLAEKMLYALTYLPSTGIKGIVQGDFLYTKPDLQITDMLGDKCVCFTPNTITYAVDVNSKEGQKILKSKMGIVFHTAYTGNSFASLNAVYNKAFYAPTKDVWMPKLADIKDMSNECNLSNNDYTFVENKLKAIIKLYTELDRTDLSALENNNTVLTAIKTFNNKLIRDGKTISSPANAVKELEKYIESIYATKYNSLKTDAGRHNSELKHQEVMNKFRGIYPTLVKIYELQNAMVDCKNILMKYLNKLNASKCFVKTNDGYVVTQGEGFVVSDVVGNAYKFVDRKEFSRLNFAISQNRKK